jgi:cysteinyl-tRNA synthetase
MGRKKEDFIAMKENNVSMYVCGPTVYDLMHIGNARPLVVFDTVRRYLLYKGFKVNFVQNFTDVDDKIIDRARELDVSAETVAETNIIEATADMRGLNCLEATSAPRATQEMDTIISMISSLIDNGYAYEKNGSVYFNTRAFERYGGLSGKDINDLNMGARVGVNDEKNDAADFVLWKPCKPGEPKWDSPWSQGRPGWHIECSAMSKKYLGDTFDIHAGGEDLIFPHHENEIAQSEAANGKPFARFWMHVGFININNEKMAKSLGNFFTLREVAEKYSYEVVRFFILSAHYRSPVNFNDELLQSAQSGLERLKNSAGLLEFAANNNSGIACDEEEIIRNAEGYVQNFENSMEDDFNTANAISTLFELAKFANKQIQDSISSTCAASILDMLLKLSGVLGLDLLKSGASDKTKEIEELIAKRQEARKSKDFKTADAIRKALTDMGVVLEDRQDGVRWSLK